MRRLLFILIVACMLVGCRKEKSASIDRKSTDSTLMMVDENHAVVYNVLTGKDEVVEVLIDLPDGTIKIDEHGDTLYWLGGGCLWSRRIYIFRGMGTLL